MPSPLVDTAARPSVLGMPARHSDAGQKEKFNYDDVQQESEGKRTVTTSGKARCRQMCCRSQTGCLFWSRGSQKAILGVLGGALGRSWYPLPLPPALEHSEASVACLRLGERAVWVLKRMDGELPYWGLWGRSWEGLGVVLGRRGGRHQLAVVA